MEVTGLSETEATNRLKKYGFNELPASGKQGILQIFLRVLREPMLLLLISCGLIYLVIGEFRDGFLLFASAIIVISITLYQETKSERALEALKDLASPRALVIRPGILRRIPGREVAIGDLMRVSEGDRIPADATITSSIHLSVDESMLTGESFSVSKEIGHKLFSGSLVVAGNALAEVTGTGPKTELGKIGRSLESAKSNPTPLQHEVNQLVRSFGSLGIIFSVAIALVYGFSRGNWPQGILAGLAAAMSLLPEEFPVIMTVFMAMGAWRIAKKNVLTRRTTAIEALGSISTLCVDKTGTLTQNQMTIRELSIKGQSVVLASTDQITPEVRHLLSIAEMACHENPFDPMEKAILSTAKRFNHEHALAIEGQLLRLYPLSSSLMAMSCAWKQKENTSLTVAAKGAPEAIFQLCHLGKFETTEALEKVRYFASRGLRVLAVAQAKYFDENLPQYQHEFDFHYLGLLAFEDPIRPEAPAAIRECRDAGIRVIMLTGDFPETAKNIAEQLQIKGPVTTGFDISRSDDLNLQQIVRNTAVFARVTPDQKLRIVNALKAVGERVAMTGDGVNDAPSLKWADIGVAMGERGTDVAREAAAIVLLDDSFTSIVSAIRLGRRIYDNLQKAVFFILAIHIPIAGLAMIPIALNLPLLLLPVHIVFLELIIDPACSLVYEAEPEEEDLMKRSPRDPRAKLVRFKDLVHTTLQGSVILALVLCFYIFSIKSGRLPEEARTAAFLTLILSNLGLIFVHRTHLGGILGALKKRNPAFTKVILATLLLIMLVLLVPPVRALFGFSPLSLVDWAIAVSVGVLSLILNNVIQNNFSVYSLSPTDL